MVTVEEEFAARHPFPEYPDLARRYGGPQRMTPRLYAKARAHYLPLIFKHYHRRGDFRHHEHADDTFHRFLVNQSVQLALSLCDAAR